MTLAGLRVHPVDINSPAGAWADCIVDEVIGHAARGDVAEVARLLLGLVLGAPRGMRVELPRRLRAD